MGSHLDQCRAELEVLYERALSVEPLDEVKQLADEVLAAFDSIDDRLFATGSAGAVAFVVGMQLRSDIEKWSHDEIEGAARLKHEVTVSLRTVDDSLRRLSDGDPRDSLLGIEPEEDLEDALLLRHAYAGLRRDLSMLSEEPSPRARARRAAAALASFLGRTISSRARLHDRALLRSLHGRARHAYTHADPESLDALWKAILEVLPFLDSINDREVLRRHDASVVARACEALDRGDVRGAVTIARALYGRRSGLDAVLESRAPEAGELRRALALVDEN
ncbi:MAG: hypothetical protein H6721_28285 [Sandaracinus sp.]|nr:hypothetical protein [Sandaracinus sp.]MCB9636028.1 hypothetical protein [Sandaracinus sp.]